MMNEYISTNVEGFQLRYAKREDSKLILDLIKELASYENLLEEVVATVESIEDSLFDRKVAEVLIGEYEGEAVSYALFFHNYSTFTGKPGIYLEDLYVRPHVRKKGFGNEIFKVLAKITIERDCKRLEWACLDWNQPSRDFYMQMGANYMDGWLLHRLDGKALEDKAK